MQNFDLVEGRQREGKLVILLDDITGTAYRIACTKDGFNASPLYQFEQTMYEPSCIIAFEIGCAVHDKWLSENQGANHEF